MFKGTKYRQTNRKRKEALETACLIQEVPAGREDLYSEEELSRVEQSIRKRRGEKREREREWNETREKTACATLERSSMRECAAQWLLIAFKSASRYSSLSLSFPWRSFALQSRHLISGTSRMISEPEPDTKPLVYRRLLSPFFSLF